MNDNDIIIFSRYLQNSEYMNFTINFSFLARIKILFGYNPLIELTQNKGQLYVKFGEVK